MTTDRSGKTPPVPSPKKAFSREASTTGWSVNPKESAETLMQQVLNLGVDGKGPWKGAEQVADEHLRHHKNAEKAIARLIATHVRNTGVSGLVTGMGGLITLPAAIPADMTALYANQIRMIAAVAHLRGYDVHSEEVRSIILLTVLGSAGTALAAEMGVTIGNKAALAMIRKVPGRVLIDINKKVGFRLFTKAGTKGVVNLTKAVPLVGGVVGGGINASSTRTIGTFAKRNFPSLHADVPEATSRHGDDVIDAEVVED